MNLEDLLSKLLQQLLKIFVDGPADCFDNRRDAERVPFVILLLANCRQENCVIGEVFYYVLKQENCINLSQLLTFVISTNE